ncbi:hypothetical protein DV736_g2716, partial [Chaetothyriales sp. CBS 134916]
MVKMEMETYRGKGTEAQPKAEIEQQKDEQVEASRQAANTLSSAQDIDGSPSIASLPNAFKHYMARPEQNIAATEKDLFVSIVLHLLGDSAQIRPTESEQPSAAEPRVRPRLEAIGGLLWHGGAATAEATSIDEIGRQQSTEPSHRDGQVLSVHFGQNPASIHPRLTRKPTLANGQKNENHLPIRHRFRERETPKPKDPLHLRRLPQALLKHPRLLTRLTYTRWMATTRREAMATVVDGIKPGLTGLTWTPDNTITVHRLLIITPMAHTTDHHIQPHRTTTEGVGMVRRVTRGPHHYQNQPTRGRGGYYSHHTWTPTGGSRGGPQNPLNSHPDSVRTSPAPSHPPSHDERDACGDDNILDVTKRSQDDSKQAPLSVPQDKSSLLKDGSKFSFAFKSKQPPIIAAKPPADLNPPAKTAPRLTNNRDLLVYPKREPQGLRPDHGLLPDRNATNSNDRKHPLERSVTDSRPRVRSQSPPPKKAKTEPLPRRLPPEYAKSESIYFRKPGNESVVGAGTYGKVFKAAHIYTGQLVALKKIRMEGERDGFPITATREIRLLQRFKHKHVVDLLETMVERNEAYMVFEYLSHDLTGLINHPTFRLTAAHKKDLAHQLFDGLDFLHRRGVLHRDIKAANILISSIGQVKYADFGLARTYSKNRQLDYTNRVITIWYRPPELVLGETQYGPAVDVWSLACVFMEMFTRKAVFPGDGSELSQLDKIYTVLGTPTRAEWPKITELPWFELMQPADRKQRQFETMFSGVLSEQGLDLVKWCFQYDPVKRPTAEEVLQHPYFTSEDPKPAQVVELEDVKGDWHEFESKAHRRGEEKRKKAEWEKDRAERKKREREAKETRKSDPVSAVLSDKGLESARPIPEPEVGGDDDSDGEGSARMDMSPE